jgi:uncharacterized protein (DUF3820 family)
MHGDWVMPLGQYKGEPLSEIPVKYLDWLLGQKWLRPETSKVIKEHLESERKSEWEELGR